MSVISANNLKTKGIKAINDALLAQLEAPVTVRGQVKYMVMSNSQYQYLRECELAAALAESKADIEAGRFIKETVAQHILRIKEINMQTAWAGS